MINIIIPCYSRQALLDEMLPGWLKQRGVEYKVIVGAGPGIVVPEHERIRVVQYPKMAIPSLATLMNKLIEAADGDIICMVHGDMKPRTTGVLSEMADKLSDRAMVTCAYVNADGVYCPGAWTHIFMADKALIVEAGKFDPIYDGGVGWEDADFLTRMGKLGCYYEQVQLPKDKAPLHLFHESVRKDEDALERYLRNKRIFNKRHGAGILANHYRKELNGHPIIV